MRRILINWKWLTLESLLEYEEPTNLQQAEFYKTISVENHIGEITILNLEREESEFEDEYEHYDERNQLFSELIQNLGDGGFLLFLHKNTPHFYENYDVKWFTEKFPNSKIILFGGGEDKLYDLYNPEFGLLDQVGNFSSDSLNQNGEIKKNHFEQLWNHYFGEKDLIEFEDKYKLFEALMTELMPSGKQNSKAIETAEVLLSQKPSWLTESVRNQLQFLTDSNSKFDWLILRNEWECCLLSN